MSAEVQTQSGRCTTHGAVEATREIPRIQFPFVVYAFLRWRAKRRPYLCPTCEEPVEAAP
jgi:hypothetical protein